MPLDDETRLMTVVGEQATTLERCAAALQKAQARLPRPSPADIEEVRTRRRPMTPSEYALARLQRAVVALEDVASDLQVDLEYGFEPPAYGLLDLDVNALEAAAQEDQE